MYVFQNLNCYIFLTFEVILSNKTYQEYLFSFTCVSGGSKWILRYLLIHTKKRVDSLHFLLNAGRNLRFRSPQRWLHLFLIAFFFSVLPTKRMLLNFELILVLVQRTAQTRFTIFLLTRIIVDGAIFSSMTVTAFFKKGLLKMATEWKKKCIFLSNWIEAASKI